MCLLCAEIKSGHLTRTEAKRNFQEMKEGLSKEHIKEVKELIKEEYDVGLSGVLSHNIDFSWYAFDFQKEV